MKPPLLPMCVFLAALALAWIGPPGRAGSALAGPRAEAADRDSDGDGLSDFQEVHKYCTDPKKKDTAGKGVSDGDWQERREFTYSVRAVIRVMQPCSGKALSEANLGETWGTRYAKGLREGAFKHENPYCLVNISDHFGKYASVPNPPVVETEHDLKEVTIEKAYWPESEDASPRVRNLKSGARPGGARFFIHVRERLENAGGYLQYKRFMAQADRDFLLQAKGHPDVPCRLSGSSTTSSTDNLRELEVVISPADYSSMAKAVPYTLHPLNTAKGYVWKVPDGLTITRE